MVPPATCCSVEPVPPHISTSINSYQGCKIYFASPCHNKNKLQIYPQKCIGMCRKQTLLPLKSFCFPVPPVPAVQTFCSPGQWNRFRRIATSISSYIIIVGWTCWQTTLVPLRPQQTRWTSPLRKIKVYTVNFGSLFTCSGDVVDVEVIFVLSIPCFLNEMSDSVWVSLWLCVFVCLSVCVWLDRSLCLRVCACVSNSVCVVVSVSL